MLVEIFYIIAAIGLVSLVLAIKWDSIVLAGISSGAWIILAAGSLYLEYPYAVEVNNTLQTGVNGVHGGYAGVFFLFLAIISVLLTWYLFMTGKQEQV